MESHENEGWHERVERKLDQLLREVHDMAIDQGTFDTDLAALVTAIDEEGTAISNLTAAVDAWIASHPGVDLTAEDQAVQAAAAAAAASSQALADELGKVTPPPAPAP